MRHSDNLDHRDEAAAQSMVIVKSIDLHKEIIHEA